MQHLVIFALKEKFETDVMPNDFADMEMKEEAQAQILYAKVGICQIWALDRKQKGTAVPFGAASINHLQRMINSFPLIKVNYADYQILPLAPYPAFARIS